MSRTAIFGVILALAQAAQANSATWVVPTGEPTLRAALAACSNGDTVLVEDGTLSGPDNRDLTVPQLDLVVRSRNGPASCTIDCDMGENWLYVFDSERPHDLLVDGFRVVRASGSAIYQLYGAVTIRDCQFEGNAKALFATGPLTVVDRCTFRHNGVLGYGQGGAVWAGLGTATFTQCLFEHNDANAGGALYGGATGTLSLEGCTISGNAVTLAGGGVYFGSGALILRRTIVWGNHSELHANADEISLYAVNQDPEPESCDLRRDGVFGTVWTFQSCIDADPRFCDAAGWESTDYRSDYRLRNDSPCLPQFTPSGTLIGALDAGCAAPQPVGACCTEFDCAVSTEQDCAAAAGSYRGDDAGCFPLPCAPVPTRVVSWGRVKSIYWP